MVKNRMAIRTQNPSARCRHFQHELTALVKGLRRDVRGVSEPRFEALLETSAEVLIGIRTAFAHYKAGRESAWKGK
jgi:hypothetical protein